MKERRVLGRGLSALIPEPAGRGADGTAASARSRDYLVVAVEDVRPNPQQPRKRFAEASLQELAKSIAEQGLIQPLVVRRDGAQFALIAGERRWRAAQRAGVLQVPVVVKDVSSAEAFEMALVENIQREDLDPIEEAEAYRRIQQERAMSTEDLAGRVGKDRSTVANAMRLLALPARVQELVATGALSAGHGRALLGLDDARALEEIAQAALDAALSVRAVERLVRAKKASGKGKAGGASGGSAGARGGEAAAKRVAEDLTRRLGTRVAIQLRGKGGQIRIDYHSLDELDRLIERFGGG